MTASTSARNTEATTTLFTIFQLLAEQHPHLTALRDPHSVPEVELTYGELFQQIQWFAGGLQSLGLQVGERVALFADNSPRWLVADLGSLFAGLVDVPRSSQADPQELRFILQNTGCTTLIVEDSKTLQRLGLSPQALGVHHLISLSDASLPDGLCFSDLLQRGQKQTFVPPALDRSQLATIIHTSGTSGQPKGVMLSHGNLMHQVECCEAIQPAPGNQVLSILPTWHVYERACEYFLLSRACTLVYTDRRHIKQDLQREAPHYLIVVPRIWENVYEGVQRQFKEKSPFMQRIIHFSQGISKQYILARRIARNESIAHYHCSSLRRLLAGVQYRLLLPLHQLADRVIYRKVRQAVGPNLRHTISGGGSLPAYLDLFYEMVGISILNGYGLTETSPVLACRRPEQNIRGTVGPAFPKTELRIVDPDSHQPLPQGRQGLIQARGPQIMQGYYNDPEATAKVLSEEGWFSTGDLGWLTPDYQLVISGRAKDTIVLSNGENIEPQPLEDVCSQSPYISQMVVVGQDEKHLGALIHPNLEAIQEWAATQGLPDTDLLQTSAVRSLLLAELRQRIRNRPGYRADDQVHDFRFVPDPFTIENGLMTQTLKVKRRQVTERYQHLIADLFNSSSRR
ncbi:MAG: long-chain fatty acid--CoA ligase [Synechococcaceae cyanobacterium SM2_3_1]|nr:long-chain fatty acid--CoA ligase [Synechococcaceae cyanobacterium SM2_3_1]